MLKTVSSITNAIGALNYKGTWNASTNTPTITSSVGVKGDYYVVSVSGTTAIDGISNWGVGDWITFNGSTWQRVEGGADLNGVNLSVSGTTNLSALTASTALALDASKDVVSVTNTGTGNNVLADGPTLTTPTLGAATATSVNKVAITAPATGSTLTIADGKTLTANNSIALTGTDATTMAFPTTNATIARTDAAQTFSGIQTFSDQVRMIRKTEYSGTSGGINNGQSLQIDITMSGGDLTFNIDVSAVGASSGGAMFYSNAILRGALSNVGAIFGNSATNLANALFSAATITGPSAFVLRITVPNSSGVNANIWNNWAISIHTNSKNVSSVVASVV